VTGRQRGDALVWTLLFVALGVMILVNLPPDPAPTGTWFLIGCGSIVVGVVVAFIALFGGRRGR